MLKNKRFSLFFGFIAVALIVFIFFNSSQTGEESGEASGFITDIVHKVLGFFGITVKRESLSFFIRKAAHFSEYFAFSLVAALFFNSSFKSKRLLLLAPITAFCVAVADEFAVQGSTLGRSPEWRDVAIDTCGAIAALVIFMLILRLRKEKSNEN